MKRYVKAAVRNPLDEPVNVQLEMLNDPEVTPDLLSELANSKGVYNSWKVRYKVASNKLTPGDALKKLSEDYEDKIRKQVALNPSTPIEVLRNMAANSNLHTKYALLENPDIDDSVLSILANDDNQALRCTAISRISNTALLDTFSNDSDPDIQYALATNPNVTQKILHKLANTPDADRFVLAEIARLSSNPEDLDKMATNHYHLVRFNVARNPYTSKETLQELAKDFNPSVQQEARHRL